MTTDGELLNIFRSGPLTVRNVVAYVVEGNGDFLMEWDYYPFVGTIDDAPVSSYDVNRAIPQINSCYGSAMVNNETASLRGDYQMVLAEALNDTTVRFRRDDDVREGFLMWHMMIFK